MKAGQESHGFRLSRVEAVPGIRASAEFFEHSATGARLLRLHAPDDPENLFAIIAPTPPPDDTGVPHIMEHSLLAGSRKYPVKEPFFELVKISMASFINAMTSQAYTVYPVASPVPRDFLNLAEVYLDAYFHPLLEEETLSREGHHLAPSNPDDPASPLTVNGIVYNEMKGVYSTPEHLLFELITAKITPDTPLGRSSGGDPDHIPELTYKQFLDFHKLRYHPSNSLILTYGDADIEKLLPLIDASLKGFGKAAPSQVMPRQPRWTKPRFSTEKYPASSEAELKERTFLSLCWLSGDALRPEDSIASEILSNLLLGNDAAPLKKALIDSKLGADLSYSGSMEHAYEQAFLVSLKGSEPGRAKAFEALVLKVLSELAEGCFDEPAVRAAFNQLRYEFQEIKSLQPLQVLNFVARTWPYGGDPLAFLNAGELIASCERRWLDDPRLFNKMIAERLLENQHRLLLELAPDLSVAKERQEAFAKKMDAVKAGLSEAQLKEIAEKAAALKARQTVPNSPEQLAKLPQLRRDGLPAKPIHIPFKKTELSGVDTLRNEIFSNGVNYLELDVDMDGLPEELTELLPLYAELFRKAGVEGQGYEDVARRRAALTGGLWCHQSAMRHASKPGLSLKRLRFGMKALDAQFEGALPLFGDLALRLDPLDKARLREVLTQSVAALRSALVNNGNLTAAREAAKGLSKEAALDWLWNSPQALRLLQRLEQGFDKEAGPLIERLLAIREFIRSKGRWTLSFTGSGKAFSQLPELLAGRPSPAASGSAGAFVPGSPVRKALVAPLQIAHCAEALPGLPLSHPDTPLLQLASYIATFDYMLPFIRLKGNAYGAGCRLNTDSCVLSLSSFRDPHIAETVAVFEGLKSFFQEAKWSELDIERAVIGSMKEAVKPLRPAEATSASLTRWIKGDSNELREARHSALLAATPESVKRVALEHLETALSKASVCVIAGREMIEAANKTLAAKPLETVDLF